MKKCSYCELKKEVSKHRKFGRFFSTCDFCKSAKDLVEHRNAKILQAKRSEFLENWLGN
jgi:hypothetical protein